MHYVAGMVFRVVAQLVYEIGKVEGMFLALGFGFVAAYNVVFFKSFVQGHGYHLICRGCPALTCTGLAEC